MINTILDFDRNASIDLSLDSENVEIKFFQPGKFANISIEHEEGILIKKIMANSYYLGKKEKEQEQRQAKNMVLYLPQDYENHMQIVAFNSATIKNEKTQSSLFLQCQNLCIKHCDFPNMKCEAMGEKIKISNSTLDTLTSISPEMSIDFSHISNLFYYSTLKSMKKAFPIFIANSMFDKIRMNALSNVYMQDVEFSHFISDEFLRDILFSETKCKDIFIKKGNALFLDCEFVLSKRMNIKDENTLVTIKNFDKKYKIKKVPFLNEYNIIKNKEKIYTIKGQHKVKILKK